MKIISRKERQTFSPQHWLRIYPIKISLILSSVISDKQEEETIYVECEEKEILSSYERPWETHRKGRKIRYTKEENNNVMSRYDHKIETSLEGIEHLSKEYKE